MHYERINDTLTLYPAGQITSVNAASFEEEALNIVQSNKASSLSIDAKELEYISSAGLRVLLILAKLSSEKVKMINASKEVYDIMDMTGFTRILDVKQALRSIDVTGCPIIGAGGNGTVYRLDEDTIVKVYRTTYSKEVIERERSFAKLAFVAGIPSVIAFDLVEVGDSYGIVFELVKGNTLAHAMKENPTQLKEYVAKHVALAKKLHSTVIASETIVRLQDIYRTRVDNLSAYCTKEEQDALRDIVNAIPEVNTVIHNDLHPGNIMLQDGECLLIDMPELTRGPAICDLAAVYRNMIIGSKSRSATAIEQSVGMPADLIYEAGKEFFRQYCDIKSEEELDAYFKKLGLFYAFNVVLLCGSSYDAMVQRAPGIMERLLRPVVLPNKETLCYLFRTM